MATGTDTGGNNFTIPDAPVAPIKTTSVKLDTPTSVPATSLTDSITSGDIGSLLKQNQQNFQDQLKAFDYSPEYQSTLKSVNDINAQIRGLQTDYVQSGIGIKNKAIPMDEIGNELTRLQENVGYRQLPLTNELQATTDKLKILQDDRNNTLAKLQLIAQNGQYNADLAMKFNDIHRQEQEAAKQLAREYNIQSPFYDQGGTIYRTSDGKPYSTPDQFFTDSGVTSFDQARKTGILTDLGDSVATKLQKEQLDLQRQSLNKGAYSYIQTGTDMFGNPTYSVFNQNSGSIGASTVGNQVGSIAGLPAYDQHNAFPGVGFASRNNNPGNIKVSDYTKNFAGVVGVDSTAALDGGNFLIFDTPEDGFNAMSRLLQEGKPYQGVTAEQAIKTWNGGGTYGAASVGLNPNQDFQSQIKDPSKLQAVVQAMAKAEGYKPYQSSSSDTGNTTPLIGPPNPNDMSGALPLSLKSALKTSNGRQYIDLGVISGDKQQQAARTYAGLLGIPLLDKQTADKVNSSVIAAQQAQALIKQIKDIASKIPFAPDRFNKPGSNLIQWISKATGNENIKLYNDRVASMMSILARASGEKGVLTDQDIARIQKALPSIYDTVGVARQKFNQFDEFFNNIMNSALDVYLPQTNGSANTNNSSGSLDDLFTKYNY